VIYLDAANDKILPDSYSDLKSGRWVIVSGERDDIEDESGAKVPGAKSSELAMPRTRD
jgi:hypothetical protein